MKKCKKCHRQISIMEEQEDKDLTLFGIGLSLIYLTIVVIHIIIGK